MRDYDPSLHAAIEDAAAEMRAEIPQTMSDAMRGLWIALSVLREHGYILEKVAS